MATKQQMVEASKAVIDALGTNLATEPPTVVLAVLDAVRFSILYAINEQGGLGSVMTAMAGVDDEEDEELEWVKDENGVLRARPAGLVLDAA